MQIDFHYYATYCAAYLAGYSHEECLAICYSAQFVDCCTRTLLSTINGPDSAATTQLKLEMMDARTDILGLQDITRIWASFHFLPRDLHADVKKGAHVYKEKYRMICGPNGDLLVKTVNLAKEKSLQAVGLAMHVLADTWAHQYFAGTPSQVINNTDYWFYELIPDEENPTDPETGSKNFTERRVTFCHNPVEKDDPEKGLYVGTIYQLQESSVMGYAMKYLRGEYETFETERYDTKTVSPYEEEIRAILEKRQLDSSAEWKALGERLSGEEIPDFDEKRYCGEYADAKGEDKVSTFLGNFFSAALAQKGMVTDQIFKSGNLLAGYSVEYRKSKLLGIRDFILFVEQELKKRRGEARS